MKNMSPQTKVQATIKNNIRTNDSANTGVEVSRGVLLSIAAAPALIGMWAAACFVGGLFASGSPFGLVKSWFIAVVGM